MLLDLRQMEASSVAYMLTVQVQPAVQSDLENKGDTLKLKGGCNMRAVSLFIPSFVTVAMLKPECLKNRRSESISETF